MSDLYLRSDSDKGETSPDTDLRLRSGADKESSGTVALTGVASQSLAEAVAGTVVIGTVIAGVTSESNAEATAGEVFAEVVVATLEQSAFRFYTDAEAPEGLAAENFSPFMESGTVFRIRHQIAATSDPDATQFNLMYRFKTAESEYGDWIQVG